VLYDAICSVCGKPTKTIFEPKAGRPVYCKSCLKKIKNSAPRPVPENTAKAPDATKPAPANRPDNSSPPRQNPEPLQKRLYEPLPLRDIAKTEPKIMPPQEKITNVSFSEAKKKSDDKRANQSQQKLKRREINLSELKKALEKSLSRSAPELKAPLRQPSTGAVLESSNAVSLQNKQPEEKASQNVSDKPQDKGVINPGEKVEL